MRLSCLAFVALLCACAAPTPSGVPFGPLPPMTAEEHARHSALIAERQESTARWTAVFEALRVQGTERDQRIEREVDRRMGALPTNATAAARRDYNARRTALRAEIHRDVERTAAERQASEAAATQQLQREQQAATICRHRAAIAAMQSPQQSLLMNVALERQAFNMCMETARSTGIMPTF